MPIASFPAGKIRMLAELSLAHPDARRPNLVQRFSTLYLKDSLSERRRAEILDGADGTFSIAIREGETDHSRIPAGVWLIGDLDLYIMFNLDMTRPGLITDPVEFAVHALETDPRNFPDPADRLARKDAIFGPHADNIFLPAEFILAITRPRRGNEVMMLEITDGGVSFPPLPVRRAWKRQMLNSGVPDFFEPDRKAPPRTWKSPAPDMAVEYAGPADPR